MKKEDLYYHGLELDFHEYFLVIHTAKVNIKTDMPQKKVLCIVAEDSLF